MIRTKIVTFLSLILMSGLHIHAQSILEVTGRSSRSCKPTQTVVTFGISVRGDTYASVIEQINKDILFLTQSLKKQGFGPDEIITRQFSISKNKKHVNGSWRDDGYSAVQQVNVLFAIDKDRLVKVLNATTGSGSRPDISIRFELDEATTSRIRAELMVAAVTDAQIKAEHIAATAGYTVTGIEKISYEGSNRANPAPVYRMTQSRMAADAGNFDSMEGSSITLSDQVFITYRISKE